MEHLGIAFQIKNAPALDPGFIPPLLWERAYLAGAEKPLGLAVERPDGCLFASRAFIHGTPGYEAADRFFAERRLKALLWRAGGCRVYVSGDREICAHLAETFGRGGARAFDADFMAGVYGRPFEVFYCETLPAGKNRPLRMGGHFEGCRIGLDAGGSVRKVSAVMDGTPVFSQETPWNPRNAEDPAYHYAGILASFRAAAEHLPRVDAVGVSSAGIFEDNRVRVSSLFMRVPAPLFEKEGRDVYIRAAAALGNPKLAVCNDGDVSALAGAMRRTSGSVLGLSLGTSEAAGFADDAGSLTGWLNELAFVPVDYSPEAGRDAWSGDTGCGAVSLSQDGVVARAERAGADLSGFSGPAQRFGRVRALLEAGDAAATAAYRCTGTCLGHTLALYHSVYGFRHALLLGGVMSGAGGALIAGEARRVLADEYPACAARFDLRLPDEAYRRIGQSVAAASL